MRALMGIAAILYVGSATCAEEKDVHALVAEANQAFADGNYAAALQAYKEAELMRPQSPELAYNYGVASYMLGDYTRARDAFNRSLLTRDVGLEERIKYNLGNVAYASALKTMSNPREAIELLKSAIVHYRDAIELDPEDDDARTNIELAQRLFRDLLQKLKEQREERRRRQDDQQERQNDDAGEQGEQQGGQQQDVGTEQQQQKQVGQQTDDRMTPQEVEWLLQAVQDKERQRREELAQRRRAGRVPIEKDW